MLITNTKAKSEETIVIVQEHDLVVSVLDIELQISVF